MMRLVGYLPRHVAVVRPTILFACMFLSAQASADPTIAWEAPPSCPSRDDFVEDVARVSSLSQLQHIPIQIRVRASQLRNGTWDGLLTLDMRGSQRERRLNAATCGAVVSGAAVVVATLLEEPVLAVSDAPIATGVVLAAPGNQSHKAAAAASAVVGVSAVGDVGSLPGAPATGADVSLGWYRPASAWRLRIVLDGSYFLPRSTNLAAVGIAGRFTLLAGEARGCATAPLKRADVGGCVGVDLGRTYGTAGGPDVVESLPARSTSFGGLAGLFAALPLVARINATFRLDSLFFVGRNTFVLKPDDVAIYRPSHLVIRMALGLELHFL